MGAVPRVRLIFSQTPQLQAPPPRASDDVDDVDGEEEELMALAPASSAAPLSEGARVLAEAQTVRDGEYSRCGTFGCILRDKHPGLHLCPPPSTKRKHSSRAPHAHHDPMARPVDRGGSRTSSSASLALVGAGGEGGEGDGGADAPEAGRCCTSAAAASNPPPLPPPPSPETSAAQGHKRLDALVAFESYGAPPPPRRTRSSPPQALALARLATDHSGVSTAPPPHLSHRSSPNPTPVPLPSREASTDQQHDVPDPWASATGGREGTAAEEDGTGCALRRPRALVASSSTSALPAPHALLHAVAHVKERPPGPSAPSLVAPSLAAPSLVSIARHIDLAAVDGEEFERLASEGEGRAPRHAPAGWAVEAHPPRHPAMLPWTDDYDYDVGMSHLSGRLRVPGSGLACAPLDPASRLHPIEPCAVGRERTDRTMCACLHDGGIEGCGGALGRTADPVDDEAYDDEDDEAYDVIQGASSSDEAEPVGGDEPGATFKTAATDTSAPVEPLAALEPRRAHPSRDNPSSLSPYTRTGPLSHLFFSGAIHATPRPRTHAQHARARALVPTSAPPCLPGWPGWLRR